MIDGLGLTGWSTQQLLSEVSVVVDPTTAVIQVSVVDTDATRATQIAARIGTVFSRLVKQRFGGTDAPVTTSGANGAVAQLPLTATIFDPAHPLPGRVSPRSRPALLCAFRTWRSAGRAAATGPGAALT